MYIYGGNTCSVNNECESGYSLYFPCIKTITRGENACFDFYILDNTTKEEVDLREVDDITLNLSGRYNCNFGSFSYPENIKSLQVENFSELIYDADFSNIINTVKLYIDIVDENHNLKESVLFDDNLLLDIAIEGNIGYFLKGSDKYGILNLNGYDTYTYMFLGWNIDENDAECDSENIYDFLIKSKNLIYNIDDDCVIRAVYQIRREFTINMSEDNFNSSFIVEYMGNKTELIEGEQITALEGHDIKVSCIPTDIMPYKFVKWEDGYENPYRVLNVSGEDTTISLKAYCELKVKYNISEINNIDNTFGETSIQLINDYEQNQNILDNIYITYELNDLTIIKNDDTGLEYEKTHEISNDAEKQLRRGNRKIEVPYKNLSGELYLWGTSKQDSRYASIYSSDGKYDTSREISMMPDYNHGIKFNSNDIFEESGKYFIIIGSNGDDYKISKFKYKIYSITPNIICQPEDKNIFVNENIILSCDADIGSYKWYNATDNTEVGTGLIDTQVTTGSNFNTNSWTTPVFNSVGLYSYYCIVTYGECSVKTNTVTISVNKYYEDNIDASTLNNFKSINPNIIDNIFVDSYFIDNIYINKCEVDILNDIPYIKILSNGYIQIDNINNIGNLKLYINNIGENCRVFINNYEVISSVIEKNEFAFEYEGGSIIITGENSCVFGFNINMEDIYQKGKCVFCLNSDDTLKLHQGELVIDGGVVVNGNPHGIPQVNFAKVSNITPLIIK